MPEGDTIYRAARTLGRALEGSRLVRFESVFPQINRVDEDQPIAGRTVMNVTSLGKHLLIRLSGNLTIRTHMRMKGSWHIYRHGERWKRSARNARIILETEEYVAVGFSIPVAETVPTDMESRDRELRRLGNDLLSDEFDPDDAVDRLRREGSSRVDDALLNQTIMAGVGNVYKSEVLFLARVHPGRKVGSLEEREVQELVSLSRELLRRNVSPDSPQAGRRRTTKLLNPDERLFVYGRGGQSCRRCGSRIARALTGKNPRVSYWCPVCQPAQHA